tara:strand:- start:1025 stop:1693 length:669 start_codon:yes stop_codon:yes gene_type:complete
MANNFKNSFASIVTAGENYQSTATATTGDENHTGPQVVYRAHDGSSDVNSILVELDASNTGNAGISVTAFITDFSSMNGTATTGLSTGTVSSITSTSDIATVTFSANHNLQVGQYVYIGGSTTAYVNGIYKVASIPTAASFTYAQNASASNGTAVAGNTSGDFNAHRVLKAYHIVKDVPIPANSTLKIVAGQKIVLNGGDKVYAYASAAHCDVIGGILEGVS